MQLDYELMMQGIVNNVRARTPKVTGNLTRNTTYQVYKNGDSIWGKLSIDTDYATFVDYGYTAHPRSKKLKRDYLYVEKSIRNELKNLVVKYGGGNVQ